MVLWLFMFFQWPIKPDSSAVIMYIWISILEVKNVSCYISLGISNGNISSCITNVLTAQPGTVQVGSGSSWDPNLNKNINNAQLAHPDPGLKGKSKFQPSILTEAQVTFSDPHNRSGVSQRERISPNANTTEANCDHALKRGKKKRKEEGGTDGKHNMSSRRLCAVIKVVLKSLSIPIKSNHLFTQVERGVGGNRGEPAQTSVRTCKLHNQKKKNPGVGIKPANFSLATVHQQIN